MINRKYELVLFNFMNNNMSSLYEGSQWSSVIIMADLRARATPTLASFLSQ